MGRKKGSICRDVWLSGPEDHRHRLYYDCQRARAQAKFRGEDWQITEQEYIDLWLKDDQYLQKSRTVDGLCMRRCNTELPWSIDNVEIITRAEHLKLCGESRRIYVQSIL